MGKRSYPPLKHAQIIDIMKALKFKPVRHGDHECWEREPDQENLQRRVVPIGDYEEFDQTLIKRIIGETGFTREQFYGATPKTAKKIR